MPSIQKTGTSVPSPLPQNPVANQSSGELKDVATTQQVSQPVVDQYDDPVPAQSRPRSDRSEAIEPYMPQRGRARPVMTDVKDAIPDLPSDLGAAAQLLADASTKTSKILATTGKAAKKAGPITSVAKEVGSVVGTVATAVGLPGEIHSVAEAGMKTHNARKSIADLKISQAQLESLSSSHIEMNDSVLSPDQLNDFILMALRSNELNGQVDAFIHCIQLAGSTAGLAGLAAPPAAVVATGLRGGAKAMKSVRSMANRRYASQAQEKLNQDPNRSDAPKLAAQIPELRRECCEIAARHLLTLSTSDNPEESPVTEFAQSVIHRAFANAKSGEEITRVGENHVKRLTDFLNTGH